MKIKEKYSHLNGEEYLLVHHKKEYTEIISVIERVDALKHKTKVSKEKGKTGKLLWSPGDINKEFEKGFESDDWKSVRRNFFVSPIPEIAKLIEPLDFDSQKKLLKSKGLPLHNSYNQTDFVKDKIAVEVQFGKYFSVTYDLFVKHLSFYTGNIINVGVEIVPMKSMQKEMSSGPPWFEKEVHNVLRHGRTNPPVPLVIIGVEP